MWIRKENNGKGLRYKYYERYKDPITRQWRKVSVTLNSNNRHAQKEAASMLNEKIQEKIKGEAERKAELLQRLTVYDVLDEWCDYMAPTVKVGTAINHRKYTGVIKEYIPPTLLFIDFTSVMAEKALRDRYYVKLYSYSYCRAVMTTLQRVMRFAKKAGYTDSIEAFNELELKKRPTTRKEVQRAANKFLNHDELASCLRQLDRMNHRLALAMEFTALTGLRIGELLALRIQDYDRENQSININGSIVNSAKNGEEGQRGTPKNIFSYRDVYLNKRAKWILEWFIASNRAAELWRKGSYRDRGGYIFTTNRGYPYNQQYINQRLKLVHVEGKHITSHIFRHTHISMLAEMGVALKAIMQRVGHNDPNTTLSIYTHVTNTMTEEAHKKIDSMSI